VIRLAIAAPSPVARAGLEALASSGSELQVVASLPDLTGVEELRPDVILASMAWDEIAAARDGAGAPIVMLTNDAQPTWTLDALRHGVRAVLGRDASQREILAAVEAAASDLAVLDPREFEGLLAGSASAAAAAPAVGDSSLTARELEVLRMMADGAANKIIAWKLGVSEHTVKFHVASILAKLRASSRTEAVTIGIRRGLVML
jgi:DNA-binding NarL/FixJ family response regulator